MPLQENNIEAPIHSIHSIHSAPCHQHSTNTHTRPSPHQLPGHIILLCALVHTSKQQLPVVSTLVASRALIQSPQKSIITSKEDATCSQCPINGRKQHSVGNNREMKKQTTTPSTVFKQNKVYLMNNGCNAINFHVSWSSDRKR